MLATQNTTMMALAELRLIFLETLQLAVIHHDAVLETVILLLHRRTQRCKLPLMLEGILQASWKRPPGWESPGPQSPRHQEGRWRRAPAVAKLSWTRASQAAEATRCPAPENC
jgi:hypothetical protein